VLSKVELESRYKVYTETYETTIAIEANLTLNIAKTSILPVVISTLKSVTSELLGLRDLGINSGTSALTANAEKIGALLDSLVKTTDDLSNAINAETKVTVMIAKMNAVREVVDALELEIDDKIWPLPKYSELIFAY